MFPNKVKKLSDAQLKAMRMTAEQMIHEIVTEAVIPFDEGTLQNISTQVDEKDLKKGIISIKHDTPYARRLYFHPEYNFNQTFNRHAKGEWWQEWLDGRKKSRPSKLYRQFYRRCTGGTVK